MTSTPDDDDAVWKALAHLTRRRILDLLAQAPRTTGDLVTELDLDRHVVISHLAVLREADLVLTERRGRYRLNFFNAVPVQQIHQRWVSAASAPWAAALIAVRDQAEGATRRALEHDDTIEDGRRSG